MRNVSIVPSCKPNHPDANHNLGALAVAVGKPLEAIPLFKLALETNPQIEQFWLSYIDALTEVDRFDEAREVLAAPSGPGVSGEKLEPFISICGSACLKMLIKANTRHYRKSEKNFRRKK